ncbi:hypothetical protein ACLB1M_22055 [Escherichia coli]
MTGKKKTCASAQAGVIHVLNPKLTSPIDPSGIAFSNLKPNATSGQSQQRRKV